jgi:hypothetical protein
MTSLQSYSVLYRNAIRQRGEAIAMLRQVVKVLAEDTNALDHPCCGWGPLYGEIKALADRLEAAD